MPLEIHRYTIASAGSLNARSSRREFSGALLRDPESLGVGCLHPWPELGDLTLDQQLARLVAGDPTPQATQTLTCLRKDGAARVAGRSLFENQTVPRSHWTAGSNDSPDDVHYAFDTAKLKAGPDLDALVQRIREWFSFAIRLDFNSTGSPELIKQLREDLGDEWERIDFIEDPFPAGDDWTRLQEELRVNFAADREIVPEAAVQIHKPAIDSTPSGRTLSTSYMDHAIGQLWAAHCASSVSPNETCGLITHPLFASDGFFEHLTHDETRLVPPAGTGLGFDETLASLPWKPLN